MHVWSAKQYENIGNQWARGEPMRKLKLKYLGWTSQSKQGIYSCVHEFLFPGSKDQLWIGSLFPSLRRLVNQDITKANTNISLGQQHLQIEFIILNYIQKEQNLNQRLKIISDYNRTKHEYDFLKTNLDAKFQAGRFCQLRCIRLLCRQKWYIIRNLGFEVWGDITCKYI